MKQDLSANSGASGASGAPDQQTQPVRPPKSAKNLYTPPILYGAIRWLAIFVFHVTSRLRLRGFSNVPKSGPFIIASNHLDWTDIPLIPLHMRRKVVYMAKEEYFSSRLAWLVRFLGAFPVKRGEADRQALRAGEEQLKKGNILVIFPEGTRSTDGSVGRFKGGSFVIALQAGLPVVPITIVGSRHVMLRGQVTVRPGNVTLIVHEPIETSAIPRDGVREFAESVRGVVAALAG